MIPMERETVILNALTNGDDRRTIVEDVRTKEFVQRLAVDRKDTLSGAWPSSSGHLHWHICRDAMPRNERA